MISTETKLTSTPDRTPAKCYRSEPVYRGLMVTGQWQWQDYLRENRKSSKSWRSSQTMLLRCYNFHSIIDNPKGQIRGVLSWARQGSALLLHESF